MLRLRHRISTPGSVALALLCTLPLARSRAQSAASPRDSTSRALLGLNFITIGSPADDDLRLRQLLGASTTGYLLRSPSSLATRQTAGEEERRFVAVLPRARMTYNSDLPYSLNDDGSLTILGVFYGGRDYSHLLHEPARPYRVRTYRKLAAIPSPGLGWSHGQTVRRLKAPGTDSGRRVNLASDSGAHREESC